MSSSVFMNMAVYVCAVNNRNPIDAVGSYPTEYPSSPSIRYHRESVVSKDIPLRWWTLLRL